MRFVRTRLRALLRRILFPRSWSGRVLGPVALGAAALLVFGVGGSWLVQRSNAIDAGRAQAGALAASVAVGIDPLQHERWSNEIPERDSIPAWQDAPADLRATREALGRALQASGVNAPIATLRPREMARDTIVNAPRSVRHGALERMVTTSQPPKWREPVDYVPAMEQALLGSTVSATGIVHADGEARVQAWAPVLDSFGQVVALVQAEVPMDARLAGVRNAHLFSAAFVLATLGGGLFVGRRRAIRAARALGALTEVANARQEAEPYLADDPAEELAALAEALEARRSQDVEEANAMRRSTHDAQCNAQAQRAACEARDAYLRELASDASDPLRRLAKAFGHVPVGELQSGEVDGLRRAVLRACELARDLGQLDELAQVANGTRTCFLAPFPLRDAVEAALERPRTAARAAQVDLRVIYGDNLPERVSGDRAILTRALELLASSSVSAVEALGSGTVSMRIKRLDLQSDGAIVFELVDPAPGDAAAVVFAPFPGALPAGGRRRGRRDLSLSIARGLLAVHGSEVVVQSEPGGTRTAFVLSRGARVAHPAARGPLSAPASANPAPANPARFAAAQATAQPPEHAAHLGRPAEAHSAS